MKSLWNSALLVRGNTPWSIILCKFKDIPDEPKDLKFFQDFVTLAGSGTDNLADYYSDQSYGKVSLQGSELRGWFVMSVTKAQLSTAGRWYRVQACIDAATLGGYTVPAGNRVMTMLNSWQDSGADGVGPGARVVLDNLAWDIRVAAHEMGHVYRLQHSWSNSSSGEYDDPLDEMSAERVYSPTMGSFQPDAVGFGGYQRDKLGWIPIDRILTIGSDGQSSHKVTLAPMSDPTQSGYLYVRMPFDPADLFNYYTVEFRTQTQWDTGILKDTVLIHEVRKFQFGPVIFMASVVFRTNGGQNRDPAQSLVADGIVIKVARTGTKTATVSISTDITGRCVQGFVWREAQPSDHVCVTAATRAQAQDDNAHASERRQGSGPFGPDTCKQGYVWREAWPGDHVCVTVATRSQAAFDNTQILARLERPW
ncbi:hypothetical protein BGX26_005899 [Mortierella sp. AD094]|nr:hypothetical protein BGX26_005899 [Mortierella sp. AD094]